MESNKTSNNHYDRTVFLYDNYQLAIDVFTRFLYDINKKTQCKILIVTNDKPDLRNRINQKQRISSNLLDFQIIPYSKVYTILGTTLDLLVIDMREEFDPNKICVLFESVRGGGIIFLIGLKAPLWFKNVNKNKFSLNLSNLDKNDVNSLKESKLLPWFIANLTTKTSCFFNEFNVEKVKNNFQPMPLNIRLEADFEGIDVTTEQKNLIIRVSTRLSDDSLQNQCSLIIANRGRGKSVAGGIILGHYIKKHFKRRPNIVISAVDIQNVQVVFRFIIEFFDKNNIIHSVIEKENIIYAIRVKKGGKISFTLPKDIVFDNRIDLILIDEAAIFPITILKKLFRKKIKKVLISTIHGYEGSGRSFQQKIIEPLKRQKEVSYKKYTLHSPIRFLDLDKVEHFLNYVFFLDADPPNLLKVKSFDKLSYEVYLKPESLLSKTGYCNLEEHIGILINSHYKNQPNDLLVLTDSKSHLLVGLYARNEEEERLLLVSGQLSYEGIITDDVVARVKSGEYIEGNLIPILALRHFSEEFSRLKGVRIVRIAVHPELTGKGFGRKMMEKIQDEFETLDWIGVSFGANMKLVKFWRKFGFKPVQIRPVQSPTTGEWNLVMIYPISKLAKTIIRQASQDFKVQFIELLRHTIHTMSYELVQEIMYSCEPLHEYRPIITGSGKIRLENYVEGKLNFLVAIDAIYELTKAYFLVDRDYSLSKSQEGLLISRVLQSRTWGQTKGKTGLDWNTSQALIRKALTKIIDHHLI
ncbi:MAG: GNAT family N-acetyltransferase [Candidatus Hodarchaeales archaeon]